MLPDLRRLTSPCALALAASALLAACGDEATPDPAPLTIEHTTPDPVQQEQHLTLRGAFGPEPLDARASVNGVCAAVTGWSPSRVTVLVPRGAGTGARLVVLQADGRASNPAPITITGPAHPRDTAYCGEELEGGLP